MRIWRLTKTWRTLNLFRHLQYLVAVGWDLTMKMKIIDLKVEGDIFFSSENLRVHHELE